ncbi:hypothetical protein DPX16_1889 [Anabarilius grahami]|uniref:Uncharacterized protein n=1 Tax=Anabarilius grahami TaxID=495550 RepID=A0A3N0YRV4_ANAGA|nr:hypothetical protein DPX16_3294 [Anabarilius grahami]ROL48949.1 hypothetical protein DPX16_1889 [Anabarilius grahami]
MAASTDAVFIQVRGKIKGVRTILLMRTGLLNKPANQLVISETVGEPEPEREAMKQGEDEREAVREEEKEREAVREEEAEAVTEEEGEDEVVREEEEKALREEEEEALREEEEALREEETEGEEDGSNLIHLALKIDGIPKMCQIFHHMNHCLDQLELLGLKLFQ